jgi:predicted ArsR family transcriptional regulator
MRPRNLEVRQRLAALLRRGPVRAADLARQLDVSARTVLRLFEELGADVCRGGATGRARYAACRPLCGSSAPS